MATKKRRVKRHNPNRRAQRFFGNVVIFTWEADLCPETGMQQAVAQAKTPRGWEALGPDTTQSITRYRNNWIVTVRAFCRNVSGNEWVEEEVRIIENQALSEFQDLYHELRAEVLSAQRLDQVVDVGWIAGTYLKNADDERLSLWGLGHYSPERQATFRQVNEQYLDERKAA